MDILSDQNQKCTDTMSILVRKCLYYSPYIICMLSRVHNIERRIILSSGVKSGRCFFNIDKCHVMSLGHSPVLCAELGSLLLKSNQLQVTIPSYFQEK